MHGMQVTRNLAFVLIRIASVAWGFLELSGFLWFHRGDRDALLSLYWVTPAIALLILGIAPARMWGNVGMRTVLLALATVGAARSIQIFFEDISTVGGPDVSSAVLRVISVALLVLLLWIRGRPNLRSSDGQSVLS